MKRFLDQKYFWTNWDESFVDNYLDSLPLELDGFLCLREVNDPYSTYDYAVDFKALTSDVIRELLK